MELCHHGALRSLSGLDLGSGCSLGLWQPPCGPSTMSALHTCLWCLFAVFLSLHSTTEQVSLNKWPLHALMSGQKFDTEEMQAEEACLCKERRGNHPECVRCNRLKLGWDCTSEGQLWTLRKSTSQNKGLSDTELTLQYFLKIFVIDFFFLYCNFESLNSILHF